MSQAIIVGEWSIFITLDAFQHLDIKAANTKLNKVVIVNVDKQGESTFSIRSHNTLPSLAEVQLSPQLDNNIFARSPSPSPSQSPLPSPSQLRSTGKDYTSASSSGIFPRNKTKTTTTLKKNRWSDNETEDVSSETESTTRDRSSVDDETSENEEPLAPVTSPADRKRRERAEMELENHEPMSISSRSSISSPSPSSLEMQQQLQQRLAEVSSPPPEFQQRNAKQSTSPVTNARTPPPPLWNMQPQWQSEYLSQRHRSGAFLFDDKYNRTFPPFASSQQQPSSHQPPAYQPPQLLQQQQQQQQPNSQTTTPSSRFHSDAIFPTSSFLLPVPNVSPSSQFPPSTTPPSSSSSTLAMPPTSPTSITSSSPSFPVSPPPATRVQASLPPPDSNPKVTMRFMLQSFVMRWHHNAPVYSAYWDQEAGEIAIEIEGQMLLDCSPSNVWDEVLLVMVKRKEGASGWKVVEQTRHCFASPFQIKISRKEKGSKNSLWYQYQVCKIDTGALLAVSPPIRPKTSRTINDKYVKNSRPPVKDFLLNCFELSFSGVTSPPPLVRNEASGEGDKEVSRRPSEREGMERRERENRRSLSNPIPPGFFGGFDRRSLTYPLPEHALHSSGTHVVEKQEQQPTQTQTQQHQSQGSITSPSSTTTPPTSSPQLSASSPGIPRPGEEGNNPAAPSATLNLNTNNPQTGPPTSNQRERPASLGGLNVYNSPGANRNF